MTFASPHYAYLLFLLPLLALLKIWADAGAQRAVNAFAKSERIRSSLLGGASLVWSGLRFGMQLLALGFFIIAMTRPQFGIEQRDLQSSGRSIFIAIDTSKSMLADDVSPNRLTRAKLAAQDLLEKLPGDRVGLIAFAGRAFLQAPLTNDHDAVVESIQSLDHTTIPRGGSSLAAAINLALETMEKVGGHQHGLVIFSDGQETDAATINAAKDAARKHLLILPVGIGTTDGALIPDPDPQRRGDYMRDDNGKVINARLEADLLRDVARIAGGQYVELASQALTRTLVDGLLARLDKQTADSRQETRAIERFQWPLFIGILLIVLSFLMRPSSRKLIRQSAPLPVEAQAQVHMPLPATARTAVLMALLIFISASSATAASVKDVDAARREYDKNNFEAARDRYTRLLAEKDPPADITELSYGLGAAAHNLKDYDRSVRAFSDALKSHDPALQKHAHRGLGTSLYNTGDEVLQKQPEATVKIWTESVAHFNSALRLLAQKKDSDDYKQIKENRDFVKKRLDDLKKKQEEQQQQQEGKDKQKKEKKKGEKGEGEPEEGDDEPEDQPKDQNKDQDPKSGNQDQKKEHDAMQNKPDKAPEGELKADQSGQKPDQQQQPSEKEDQKNDKTGFSPMEARSQLRNYADDQKSVQYLMKRERPENGKDY